MPEAEFELKVVGNYIFSKEYFSLKNYKKKEI